MTSKIALVLVLATNACAPFAFEDHLRLTTGLADWSVSKHLCVEKSDKIAAVDVAKACIKYNKQKLSMIADKWGIDAAKGVWLHEIAHIKQIKEGKFRNMHTFSHVDQKKLELEADAFVGCNMRKQKLNHEVFIEYLQTKYVPDSKHGSLEQRVDAVREGYSQCSQ